MASLQVLNENPTRLELGKGGAGSIGTLIGVLIFGIVACVGLSSVLGEGGALNPVMIVIFIIVGAAMLSSLARAFTNTRVVLDAKQGLATRTENVFFIPTKQQAIAYNLIREVQVTGASLAASATTTTPNWRVQLNATDGTTLVVNDRGTRSEMDALAQQVSALVNRPIRGENQPTSEAPASNYTPTGVMTSLYDNLVTFAQSTMPAGVAVPYVASDTSPSAQQADTERTLRGQRRRRNKNQPTPANTFSETTPPVNADAPFTQVSAELAAQQAALAKYNAENAPSPSYYAPAVMGMPELPGMTAFAPALDLPSFPALGSVLATQPLTIFDAPEIKQVESQVSSDEREAPNDSLAYYRSARQMYAMRNLSGAQDAYLRALSTNPADSAIQNDLGVTYYEQNKMQEAERSFRRAVALDPFANASRYNLGLVLQRTGRGKEAYEQFKVGLQNADRDSAGMFRDASRGILRAPMTSPSP
ncbi:MAG: tetratricopeptide repeat protein [Chloroflexota bacterium]|nr:MAG: tetratricopeptide repeat protein [Chloroflexota bacterium]